MEWRVNDLISTVEWGRDLLFLYGCLICKCIGDERTEDRGGKGMGLDWWRMKEGGGCLAYCLHMIFSFFSVFGNESEESLQGVQKEEFKSKVNKS